MTVADAVAASAAVRARNYNEEGIEMFVGLGREPGGDGELGTLLERYREQLGGDTARALEVLAAHHFDRDAPGHLRVINFHNTTRARAREYERQLLEAGERFSPVTEDDLLALLAGEPWAKEKPGLVPVLYEGYRNSYDVALPLVERAGLCAWFVVPTAFVDAPVAEQAELARRCRIGLVDEQPPDGRHALSWDELRDAAARGHAVLCHTAHHVGIADLASDADVERELVRSRGRLEEELGRAVHGLAFLWGSPLGLDARVDAAVRAAGYRYVVSNTKIELCNQ